MAFSLTSKYLYYSSDLSLLPSNIPDIILPPTFFTALFWVALLLWALGVASIYVSSVYPIERYNIKAYANLVTHVALPVGMTDLYLLREDLLITPLPRSCSLVGCICLLSEVCKWLQCHRQIRRLTKSSTVCANRICIHSWVVSRLTENKTFDSM